MLDLFLIVAGLIILFILVLANNRRNQNKLRKGRRRDFKENYYARKKGRGKKG